MDRLAVRFEGKQVLSGISLTLRSGDSLAVIGPNGAGKTVLLRALVGTVPHEGEVRWRPGTRLGYVPQKLDIERDLPVTASELLAAKARVVGASTAGSTALLEAVGLPAAAGDRPISVLSGGQFHRLLLALALVGDPDALLLDEPTAGVDEPGQELLESGVRRLQAERGLAVVLVSHDIGFVGRNATHVLCLGHAGPFLGAPGEVLTAERLEAAYGAPLRLHRHPVEAGR